MLMVRRGNLTVVVAHISLRPGGGAASHEQEPGQSGNEDSAKKYAHGYLSTRATARGGSAAGLPKRSSASGALTRTVCT